MSQASTYKVQDNYERINAHLKKYEEKKNNPKTRDPLNFKSLSSNGYVPIDYQNPKDTKELECKFGKHKQDRRRDFESQIMTLPGPQKIGQRKLQEKKVTVPQHSSQMLRQKQNEALYSDLNCKHTIGPAPYSHPSYNKDVKNQGISSIKQGYKMKDFVLGTKYNFMTGE